MPQTNNKKSKAPAKAGSKNKSATKVAEKRIAKRIGAVEAAIGNLELSKPPRKVASALRKAASPSAVSILASFALPSEVPPQRVAASVRTKQTALLRLERTIGSSWSLTLDSYSMGVNSGFVILRNDALSGFIYPSYPTIANGAAQFPTTMFGFRDQTANPTGLGTSITMQSNLPARDLPIVYRDNAMLGVGFNGTLDTFTKVYSSTVDGNQGSRRFIWIDDVQFLTFNSVTGSAVAATSNIAVEIRATRFDGKSFNDNAYVGIFAGVGSGSAGQSCSCALGSLPAGWYAFNYNCLVTSSTGANLNVAFTVNCSSYTLQANSPVLNHCPMNDIDLHSPDVADYRVPAAGLLLSNITNQLNLGGDITSAQTAPGSSFYPVLRGGGAAVQYSGSPFVNVAKITQAWKGSARTGAYGFMKPADAVSLARLDDTFESGASSFVVDAWGAICSEDGDYITAWQCPNGTTQAFEMRFTHHIEFVTDSQWFEKRVQDMPAKQYMAIVDKLSDIPQFCENPNHLELFEGVRDALSSIGRGIAAAPSVLTPIFDNYADLFDHVRSRANKSAPRLGSMLTAILG